MTRRLEPVQITLTAEQLAEVKRIAVARRLRRTVVIREAVDLYLGHDVTGPRCFGCTCPRCVGRR